MLIIGKFNINNQIAFEEIMPHITVKNACSGLGNALL